MERVTDAATHAIIERACQWLITMNDDGGTIRDRAAFAEWLTESPVHVREYLMAAWTWSMLGDALKADSFRIDDLNTEDETVVPIRPSV